MGAGEEPGRWKLGSWIPEVSVELGVLPGGGWEGAGS